MIDITSNLGTRLDDLLQLNLDKVIIGVDMLFDEALDLEKGGEEVPFILGGVDGVCEGFVAVEGLEKGVESLRAVNIYHILYIRAREETYVGGWGVARYGGRRFTTQLRLRLGWGMFWNWFWSVNWCRCSLGGGFGGTELALPLEGRVGGENGTLLESSLVCVRAVPLRHEEGR